MMLDVLCDFVKYSIALSSFYYYDYYIMAQERNSFLHQVRYLISIFSGKTRPYEKRNQMRPFIIFYFSSLDTKKNGLK